MMIRYNTSVWLCIYLLNYIITHVDIPTLYSSILFYYVYINVLQWITLFLMIDRSCLSVSVTNYSFLNLVF